MSLIGFDGNISSSSATYYNPAFVAAIKDINPNVYRTPGSVVNEDFHWRYEKPTLDEVFLMWKVVKCKMIFVLNMLTKTKENQLKMLLYAANLGMSIDFIEMGNEFNIMGSAGNTRFPTGTDYAKAVLEWRNLIEQDFPDAKFLCVGENKGGPKNPLHTWNTDVLTLNPDAGLVFHWHAQYDYCINGITQPDLIKDAIEEAYLAAFPGIPTDKVNVTEFNVGQGVREDRADPKFADDSEQILAVTTMLQKFKEMNFPLVCYHNITGMQGYGAVYSDRFKTKILPAGTAVKKVIAAI